MMKNNTGGEVSGEPQRKKKFWGLRIFSGLVILMMIGGVIYFQDVKNTHQKELDNAKADYRAIKEKVSRVENIKQKRIDFFKNRLLADLPAKYFFVSADFIRRLSLIAAPGITLSGIEITPGRHSVRFSIAGSVTRTNQTIMESRFFRFKQAIEAFDDVMLVSGQKKREETAGRGLDFTIEGEIELL